MDKQVEALRNKAEFWHKQSLLYKYDPLQDNAYQYCCDLSEAYRHEAEELEAKV